MSLRDERYSRLQEALTYQEDIGSFEICARPSRQEICAALKQLAREDRRCAEVVRLYYCIDHQSIGSYEDLGRRFGVTRERIRQIALQGVRRLQGILLRNLQEQVFVRICNMDPEYAKLPLEAARKKFADTLSPETFRSITSSLGISALSLSYRAHHCLLNEGIRTVDALAKCDRWQLMRLPNFGRISLAEVERKLAERGLKLADA